MAFEKSSLCVTPPLLGHHGVCAKLHSKFQPQLQPESTQNRPNLACAVMANVRETLENRQQIRLSFAR